MIEVKNISKRFGDHQVLNDVSARFEAGRANLVIGQSGSGKTVLIKCLVGLEEVDEGEVMYDDRSFNHASQKDKKNIRKEIGMLFQGGALFDYMNVEGNVMFPLSMFTKWSFKEKKERVDFCLERVNLAGKGNLMPSELSGGMIKRVAIARAISLNPKYLFCDEPNSGLDPKTADVIDELIIEITRENNITTIINTHDMNSVLTIGENINYIFEGRIWWRGNKEQVMNTTNKELNDFIFATELTRRIKR
jgi:phospholipid/cholesterol/gamma-HCH transport system ATP-binding protein